MEKIYHRATLPKPKAEEKKKRNEKNRVRNVIVNFRVTPGEKKLIDERIRLTGLSRHAFFLQSCLYQTILVKGNAKTFGEIRAAVDRIVEAIDRNPSLDVQDPELLESLKTILEILKRFYGRE